MDTKTLLQTQHCIHDENHLKEIEKIPLDKLFPGKSFHVPMFVTGLRANECLRCGKILVYEDKGRLDNLKKAAEDLQKSHIGESIVINLNGDKHAQANVYDQGLPANNDPLAETASFQSVTPKYDLDQVVLPALTKAKLGQIRSRIAFGDLFYIKYDFQRVRPYGKATVVLFYGPSGTGKTRTAQGLASTLGLNFLDINLADLESRFMSQTSKNIRNAFEAAKAQQALIFFDEADTVLGKRLSSVTQGVDAEINMSRSTMLKELEQFEGVCVFATNFESNIDTAFVRRITYKIPFVLPDEHERERIWDYFLLDTLPLESMKENWLVELAALSDGMSGADIATAVEMTFPMAVAEDIEKPMITKAFLIEAIGNVKMGKDAISVSAEVQEIQKMYNLK